MSKIIIINLGNGSLENGFPTVTLQIWAEDRSSPILQTIGMLPIGSNIAKIYQRWRSLYRSLYQIQGLNLREEINQGIKIEQDDLTNISEVDFSDLCQELKFQINAWLNHNLYDEIKSQFHYCLNHQEEIRVIIQTEDILTRQLPWHLWDFFDEYQNAELALSMTQYKIVKQTQLTRNKNKVAILVVLGESMGIDIEKDLDSFKKLPKADIKILIEPSTDEFKKQLGQKNWDILFFAGHSSSENEGEIYINANEVLTIEMLKSSFEKAIFNGLKLVILNSCDGLGVATALGNLSIPQVIVMREVVADKIAQEFLKYFLRYFSGGDSLYGSVRKARERLAEWETEFPCGNWLPIICQNPSEVPPTWENLCNSKLVKISASDRQKSSEILQSLKFKYEAALGIFLCLIFSQVSLSLFAHFQNKYESKNSLPSIRPRLEKDYIIESLNKTEKIPENSEIQVNSVNPLLGISIKSFSATGTPNDEYTNIYPASLSFISSESTFTLAPLPAIEPILIPDFKKADMASLINRGKVIFMSEDGKNKKSTMFPSVLHLQRYPNSIGFNIADKTTAMLLKNDNQISAIKPKVPLPNENKITINPAIALFIRQQYGRSSLTSNVRNSDYIISSTIGINGTVILNPTAGSGSGGNITINNRDMIRKPEAGIFTSTFASDNGGNITINTRDMILKHGAGIFTSTFELGNAGDITINARHIILKDRIRVSGSLSEMSNGNDTRAIPGTILTEGNINTGIFSGIFPLAPKKSYNWIDFSPNTNEVKISENTDNPLTLSALTNTEQNKVATCGNCFSPHTSLADSKYVLSYQNNIPSQFQLTPNVSEKEPALGGR